MDKYKRYVLRNVAKGQCPHCGKPCAPFYECEKRRLDHGIRKALRRMEKLGLVRREGDRWIWAGGHRRLDTRRAGGPKDGRRLPRPQNASPERLQAICNWANENDVQSAAQSEE